MNVDNIFDKNSNERIVKRDLVEEKVKTWQCGYIECSAKENSNVIEVFEKVLSQSNIECSLIGAVNRRQIPLQPNSRRNSSIFINITQFAHFDVMRFPNFIRSIFHFRT